MPRCCGGSSCSCLIQSSGAQISVTGSGQASDPYVIHGGVDLDVVDSSVFNLSLSGLGTEDSPWALGVAFAATAVLDDIPDVNITSVANAQVLGWDAGTSKWTNRAPTTAASGSVTTDPSLSGDGSGGSPLQVREDAAGFLATGAAGLGLSTTGKNRIIRHHANDAARTAATPAPDLNALTMLDSVPGRIDFWTGTLWEEYGQFTTDYGSSEMLALSGSYTGTGKVTMMVRQIATTTDGLGFFDVLSTADLSGAAGVLGCWFQPTLSTVYQVVLENAVTKVVGHAYKLTDGTDHISQNVSGVVFALVY